MICVLLYVDRDQGFVTGLDRLTPKELALMRPEFIYRADDGEGGDPPAGGGARRRAKLWHRAVDKIYCSDRVSFFKFLLFTGLSLFLSSKLVTVKFLLKRELKAGAATASRAEQTPPETQCRLTDIPPLLRKSHLYLNSAALRAPYLHSSFILLFFLYFNCHS